MPIKLPSSISNALQTPMDRKKFLKSAGTAGLFVVGAGVIVESLGGFSKLAGDQISQSGTRSASTTNFYGTSVYGGRKTFASTAR